MLQAFAASLLTLHALLLQATLVLGTCGPLATAPLQALNVQSTATNWSICSGAACAGGTGTPISPSITPGIASPSLSGASIQLQFTTSTPSTNVLWPNKQAGCEACNRFVSEVHINLPSLTYIDQVEFDTFSFKTSINMEIMFGWQYDYTAGVWDKWRQDTEQWIPTTITQAPVVGWNDLRYEGHTIAGDVSACGGFTCMYTDQVTVNGTPYVVNWVEPAGTLPAEWTAATGMQVQLNSTHLTPPANTVIVEYVDNANFQAYYN